MFFSRSPNSSHLFFRRGCCAPESLRPPAPAPNSFLPADTVVYALYMEVDTVDAVTINATSGQIISQQPVTGFHNFGEVLFVTTIS
jgi:hypothetical protein